MPTVLSSGYVDDAINAQQVATYVGTTLVGGMEAFSATVHIPKELVGTTDGLVRYRRTGPIQVDWTARRLRLQKSSIVDFFGSVAGGGGTVPTTGGLGGVGGNVTTNYGNYNWDQLIFDIQQVFTSAYGSYSQVQQLSWVLRMCTITQYALEVSNAFDFLLENVQGIAIAYYETPNVS